MGGTKHFFKFAMFLT